MIETHKQKTRLQAHHKITDSATQTHTHISGERLAGCLPFNVTPAFATTLAWQVWTHRGRSESQARSRRRGVGKKDDGRLLKLHGAF